MSSICLTESELQEITGKKRPSAQIRELNRLMIDAKQRGDGKVIVFRSALPTVEKTRNNKHIEPDYSVLR